MEFTIQRIRRPALPPSPARFYFSFGVLTGYVLCLIVRYVFGAVWVA